MSRRVQNGDPLIIQPRDWNGLLEILDQSRGAGQGQAIGFRDSVTCLVKNMTGAALPRFGVVGLGDPLIDPNDNEGEFLRRIAFAGVLATDGDYDLKWGLTIEPIRSGEIGAVVVQGLSFAKIDTADATEAGPADDGNVEALTSVSCSLARVLWRDSGSGDKWAIVCLG